MRGIEWEKTEPEGVSRSEREACLPLDPEREPEGVSRSEWEACLPLDLEAGVIDDGYRGNADE
jgi:hypothetical protein